MDKTEVCGTSDTSSILVGCTTLRSDFIRASRGRPHILAQGFAWQAIWRVAPNGKAAASKAVARKGLGVRILYSPHEKNNKKIPTSF